MIPRIFNILVGAWLIFSTFAWRHTTTEEANTIFSGVLAVGLAMTAIFLRPLRYGNAVLGTWLSLSTLLTSPVSRPNPTLINNTVAAAAIFLAAFLGRGRAQRPSSKSAD